ncbi:hypothetical protein C5167_006214 [Papaver somniferum]|uniref:O-fucosyltransferase family protein n=1 Tax=Papaver somniferum TaxID=3469 RepID=A0A4Y7JGI4_PAPSO|nr:hypothetical protein C5167_006214 [Papaver somniferum]
MSGNKITFPLLLEDILQQLYESDSIPQMQVVKSPGIIIRVNFVHLLLGCVVDNLTWHMLSWPLLLQLGGGEADGKLIQVILEITKHLMSALEGHGGSYPHSPVCEQTGDGKSTHFSVCLTNYKELKFADPISALAEQLVPCMIEKSAKTGGKYVAVHLRFEENMVAFSRRVYDGGETEKMKMEAAREKGGMCFDNNTSIFLASGRIYLGRNLAPVLQMFPLLKSACAWRDLHIQLLEVAYSMLLSDLSTPKQGSRVPRTCIVSSHVEDLAEAVVPWGALYGNFVQHML